MNVQDGLTSKKVINLFINRTTFRNVTDLNKLKA
jgi:hypothetical protein